MECARCGEELSELEEELAVLLVEAGEEAEPLCDACSVATADMPVDPLEMAVVQEAERNGDLPSEEVE